MLRVDPIGFNRNFFGSQAGSILLANSNRLIFNEFKITLTLFNEGVSR